MSTKIDLSEFFKYSRPRKKACAIGFANSQLGDTEKQQLQAALEQDNGIITGSAIQQWLTARSHEASIPAITAHRKGVCSCGDE